MLLSKSLAGPGMAVVGGCRFGLRVGMVQDGYRDVSVSVLFTHPSSSLSIIGEIQVRSERGLAVRISRSLPPAQGTHAL